MILWVRKRGWLWQLVDEVGEAIFRLVRNWRSCDPTWAATRHFSDLRYDCRWIADQGADTSSGLHVCLYSIMPQWQGQGSHIWQHWSECSYHDPCIMYTSISPHVAFRLLRQARMMDRDDSIYLASSQIGLGRWWDLISWTRETRPNENLIISN